MLMKDEEGRKEQRVAMTMREGRERQRCGEEREEKGTGAVMAAAPVILAPMASAPPAPNIVTVLHVAWGETVS